VCVVFSAAAATPLWGAHGSAAVDFMISMLSSATGRKFEKTQSVATYVPL
jgi:hypothetical protein